MDTSSQESSWSVDTPLLSICSPTPTASTKPSSVLLAISTSVTMADPWSSQAPPTDWVSSTPTSSLPWDSASCSSPETKVSVRPQNLIFVEKLDQVKLGLMGKYKTIEVETITFDFDIPYTEEGYRPLKESLDKVKDISVLVNNVGALAYGCYNVTPINTLNTVLQVNCIPQMVMTKYLLPAMLVRSENGGKRCAIVNISSVANYTNLAKTAMYCATKSYNKALSSVLNKEVGEHIDVMAVLPGPTRSNMIKFDGPFVIDAERHVRWALSDLGYNKQTFGHYKHWIYANGYRLPLFESWYTGLRERRIAQMK